MKPLKTAQQKNVAIANERYTKAEYEALRSIKGVFSNPFNATPCVELLVSPAEVKILTVALDDYGYYCNVVEMKSGEKIVVNL